MKIDKAYKILLADDHILLRDALAKLVNTFKDFSVAGVAANGGQLIEYIKLEKKIDVVLMDLSMPEMDGFEAAKWLFKYRPDVHILVLTMYDSDVALIRLLQSGVKGFLKKDIHPDELQKALQTVVLGDFYYAEQTNSKIFTLFAKDDKKMLDVEKAILDEQEIEFIKLASTEKTYREIAGIMSMSPRYIESYRQRVFSKLNIKSRVGLAMYAIKKGIISLESL